MFMTATIRRRLRGMFRWIMSVAVCSVLLSPTPATALDPDNPVVKAAIDRGVRFLEGSNDGRLGAKALVGLTLVKYGADKKHAKITSAVAAIQKAVKVGPEKLRADIYSTGISIMFLVALDPSRYRYEIEVLVKSLHHRQKAHGAWGYPLESANGGTCDTSMTQYAVLGLWEADDQAGVPTRPEIWDHVAEWLIKTQSTNGGYGYQGKPSPSLDQRVKQSGVRNSMTVAALGSLFIVRNQLGHGDLKKREDDDTPEALQLFESPEEKQARLKSTINLRYFYKAITAGNRWVDDNYKREPTGSWIHYYLYALERFQSLKEGNQQRFVVAEKSPRWYQDGARFLLKSQKEDGSWEGNAKAVPDTCFSVLFLMRSTRKTLQKSSVVRYKSSGLSGGRGVPATQEVRLRDGKVVVKPLSAKLEDVFAIIARPGDKRHAKAVEALADKASKGDPRELARHGKALTRLALTGQGDTRVIAIKALSRIRNLDHAPALIHLLDDADLQVALSARDALRKASRKPVGFGLRAGSSAQQRAAAIQGWRRWFAAIHPEVDLDSLDYSSASP